jgi:hypothetical protein
VYVALSDVLQGGGTPEHLAAAGGDSGGPVPQTPLPRRAYEVRGQCHDLFIIIDSELDRDLLSLECASASASQDVARPASVCSSAVGVAQCRSRTASL